MTRLTTEAGTNFQARIKPHGDWITFTPFRDWKNDIWRMCPDGSEETRLTFDPRKDWQPRRGPKPVPASVTP